MADPTGPDQRRPEALHDAPTDTHDAPTLMREDKVPRDPDTGAAGTTNPRSATPMGSTRPTAVVPPRRGETKWLVAVGAAVVLIVVVLLVLA